MFFRANNAKALTIISGILLSFSQISYASDQYKSNINRVYDLSRQIRSLPGAKHPAYGKLIKECRDYLYIAMSNLAQFDDWDALGSTLPGPEICSYTGTVLNRTVAEYEQKLMEARGNTRVKQAVVPVEKSPFVDEPKNNGPFELEAAPEKSSNFANNLPEAKKPQTNSKVVDFNFTGIDREKLKSDLSYNKIVYDSFMTFLNDKAKLYSENEVDVSRLAEQCLKHMDVLWINQLPKPYRPLKKMLTPALCYEIIGTILEDEDLAERDISILQEIIPYIEKTDLSSAWIEASFKLGFKGMDTGRGQQIWNYVNDRIITRSIFLSVYKDLQQNIQ